MCETSKRVRLKDSKVHEPLLEPPFRDIARLVGSILEYETEVVFQGIVDLRGRGLCCYVRYHHLVRRVAFQNIH